MCGTPEENMPLDRELLEAALISFERRRTARRRANRRGAEYVRRPRVGEVIGVNYFFGSTTTISPYRVDSAFLLPNATRCLMKNVTRPNERDGWQIEEATERDNETGTD